MNRFFLAGAPVPPSLVENLQAFLPKGQVIVPYGATEALPVSLGFGRSNFKAQKFNPQWKGLFVGSPVPGAKVTIVPSVCPPLSDHPEIILVLSREWLVRFVYLARW